MFPNLLDAVGEAVIATDLSGRIVVWNTAAERLYGWSVQEALGQSVYEIVVADEAREHASEIMEALTRGLSWTGEFRVRRRDGTSFLARVTDAPIYDAAGKLTGVVGVSSDITEMKRAQQRAEREAALVRTLHRIGSTLVSELDERKLVREVSKEATALTGATFGTFYYAAEGAPDIGRATRSADAQSEPSVLALYPFRQALPADHAFRSLLAVPVRSQSGLTLGALVFAHQQPDWFSEEHEKMAVGIAAWASVAMDNARLYQRLSEANKTKSDFLAVMSHELRTPLSAVIGYADLLESQISGTLNEIQAKHVARIRTSAWHQLGLIEQILLYARAEAGREQLHIEDTDAAAVCRDAMSLVAPLAEAKKLPLVLEGTELPLLMRTDADKLRQMLINLLSNAVKFTERGEVKLTARMTDGEFVAVIRDSGLGIAPENLARIFEPFWQVEDPITRLRGGSGLGLSVTRNLARLLGGDVAVESQVGQGSTFRLTLPLEPTKFDV
jgi:PAS domain S-box-containing protein